MSTLVLNESKGILNENGGFITTVRMMATVSNG